MLVLYLVKSHNSTNWLCVGQTTKPKSLKSFECFSCVSGLQYYLCLSAYFYCWVTMEGILGARKSSSGCDLLERLPGQESAAWKALNVTCGFIRWKSSLPTLRFVSVSDLLLIVRHKSLIGVFLNLFQSVLCDMRSFPFGMKFGFMDSKWDRLYEKTL